MILACCLYLVGALLLIWKGLEVIFDFLIHVSVTLEIIKMKGYMVVIEDGITKSYELDRVEWAVQNLVMELRLFLLIFMVSLYIYIPIYGLTLP